MIIARMHESSKARIREPQRIGQQVVFTIAEDSLAADHPARLFWTALGEFDLSAFVAGTTAVAGRPGRSNYSPRMMLTLWGYALYDGVVHARKIARLLHRDFTYRWIVGDVMVEHSALSAFLRLHRDALCALLSDVLATLMHANLLFLPTQRLAQDGTKVRANVAAGSFRTEEGLALCRQQAELHLKAVLAKMDDPALKIPEQEARERGAMDVMDRIKAATQTLAEIKEARARSHASGAKRPKREATASTTDPDARIMKLLNGGFVPAYNVQLATLGNADGSGALTLVGVQVLSKGTDKGSVLPMREQITARTGVAPSQVLVDGDHITLEELRGAATEGLEIVGPVPENWRPDGREQDDVSRAWMERMKTEAQREIYRARKALAERPNAILKTTMNLDRMPVRGLPGVHGFMLLVAIMVNLREHQQLWLN